jgi:hypothetical protein
VSSVFGPTITSGTADTLARMSVCPAADELLRRSVV